MKYGILFRFSYQDEFGAALFSNGEFRFFSTPKDATEWINSALGKVDFRVVTERWLEENYA